MAASPPHPPHDHATMPLYTVYYPPPSLAPVDRAFIARWITKSHVSVTGAPAFLVKVIFVPLDPTSYFSGGEQETALLRIVGVIRAGRSKEERQRLLLELSILKQSFTEDIEIHLEEMLSEVSHRSSGILTVEYRY
jgi:phenylpyruvate tautomerase PptA (4-oxalocrotonate tautomerase family)